MPNIILTEPVLAFGAAAGDIIEIDAHTAAFWVDRGKAEYTDEVITVTEDVDEDDDEDTDVEKLAEAKDTVRVATNEVEVATNPFAGDRGAQEPPDVPGTDSQRVEPDTDENSTQET